MVRINDAHGRIIWLVADLNLGIVRMGHDNWRHVVRHAFQPSHVIRSTNIMHATHVVFIVKHDEIVLVVSGLGTLHARLRNPPHGRRPKMGMGCQHLLLFVRPQQVQAQQQK